MQQFTSQNPGYREYTILMIFFLYFNILLSKLFLFQVILFGAERFASVFFINHTHEALRHLFIQGYDEPSPFNYFSRQDLANAIIFAEESVSMYDIFQVTVFFVSKNWKNRFFKSLSNIACYT